MQEAIKTIEAAIVKNIEDKVRSPHLDMALGRLQTAVDNLRELAGDMARHGTAITQAPEPAAKGK